METIIGDYIVFYYRDSFPHSPNKHQAEDFKTLNPKP